MALAASAGGCLGTAVIAVVLQENLAHLLKPAMSGATAAAFAETYWWVVGMTLLALIPAVVLWRIERRTRIENVPSEMDAYTIEALA